MYELRTVSQFKDHVMYLIMIGTEEPSCPTSMDWRAGFTQLRYGINNLSKTFGRDPTIKLLVVCDAALEMYKLGDVKEGRWLLQNVHEYIRLRKYKTDENVVDESRFQR